MDLLLRVLIGGGVVSFFAILGDIIKPKSLAGITAAAPALALATLVLTLHQKGVAYTVSEGRSMFAGAVAYLCFALAVSYVQMRGKHKALLTASAVLPLWCVVAGLLWAVWLRR